MGETIIGWMKRFAVAGLGVLAVALPLPSDAQAASRKPPARAQPVAQPVPSPALAPSPPPGSDLKARLAWVSQEADRQRALVGKSPYDEQLRLNIAVLVVQIARDIEHALAVGEIETGAALRQVIEKKLADTRWRLNWMSQRNMSGADFALGVMSQHGILENKDAVLACQRFASAWSKGFLEAAFRLSGCYQEKQPAQSAALLRAAADAGNVAAGQQLGRSCLESRPPDTKCALRYLSAAASGGGAPARSLLGWMYAQGVGVERDPFLAEKLYLEAAAAGDMSARNNLGELYETGRGVKEDRGRAFEYYRLAAEAWFVPAQFNLGRLYVAGSGVERDVVKARMWLVRALDGGAQPAKQLLDWLDKQEAAARK